MRQVILISLAVLLVSPMLSANDRHAWANVEHLRPGTRVFIEYWNGSRLTGAIESTGDSGLVLVGHYPNPHPGLARRIDRDLILRVRLTPNMPRLPDTQKCAVVAAVVGGIGGAVAGAAGTKSGKGVVAVFGGGLGALVGYAGGALVCGVVALARTVPAIISHPAKVVYEDPGPRPVSLSAP